MIQFIFWIIVQLSFANVEFRKGLIEIGKVRLMVEFAETDSQRAQGLMNRSELKDGEGMLFIFKEEEQLSFWMKNTLIPLSIAFFKKDGSFSELIDMRVEPLGTLNFPSYMSKEPAKYALEVPQGYFKRSKISLLNKKLKIL